MCLLGFICLVLLGSGCHYGWSKPIFSLSFPLSWSRPSLWRREAVQLHSTQFLGESPRGAEGDQCRVFPRCLLVQRCGGNCACGTDNWNSCSCSAGKTVKKLHEVSHNALRWMTAFKQVSKHSLHLPLVSQTDSPAPRLTPLVESSGWLNTQIKYSGFWCPNKIIL